MKNSARNENRGRDEGRKEDTTIRTTGFLVALLIAAICSVMLAPPAAEAVKVKDLSTGSYVTPAWSINPFSPAGETVVTVDPGDPQNFEIKLGVSSFGSVQSDTQTSAIYGAGALLPLSPLGYQVEFTTTVYGWDSYDVIGTPAPGATGYWDVFTVHLGQTDYYWNLVNGGTGATGDPIVSPDPAGNCVSTTANPGPPPCLPGVSNIGGAMWAWGALDYANNTFESNAGTYTLPFMGTGAGPYFLSVILDTATLPEADAAYPSFGAFNPLSEVPPPTLVPEPGTLLLVGSGLVALAARRWRKGNRSAPSHPRER